MDAGIADTMNRQLARVIARHLDSVDRDLGFDTEGNPWHEAPISATFLDDTPEFASDRSWLVGMIATRAQFTTSTSDLSFDAYPADGDWENLFSCIRAEILARRDPKTPPAPGAETSPSSVV